MAIDSKNTGSPDYEHLKLCAARYAWKYRDRITPSARREGKRITWEHWFLRMYGEDLHKYRARLKRDIKKS